MILAAVLSACYPAPRSAAPPHLSPVAQLQRDLDAILAAPALEHSVWGVLIKSLASDETLYGVNAGRLLMPASNMKIVTLAAAAERLGWDYRYETRVFGSAPIEAGAGVLHGDLIVVGSGDPSIGGRSGPPTRVFDAWADELRDLGLRQVDGRIVGDDRAFEDRRLGAGWAWDDLGEGYAAGAGALQFNENGVRATIAPGQAVGDPAIVTLEPAGSGLVVQNELKTAPEDALPSIRAQRLPGGARTELRGLVPLSRAPTSHTVSVDDPALFFVTVLRNTLIARGIDVRGPPVNRADIRDIDAVASSGAAPALLLSYRSPPLSSLAVTLMKVSQNLYAETLLKTIGAAGGSPTTDAGRASARSAVLGWGVEAGELIMRDGSGLSRYNYATPQTLVTILTHVDRDEKLREPFESALPIAGQDGTLAGRMIDTAAAGNARAKTGSIANARALSGYVRTSDGEPLVFSIIANNFETPPSAVEQTTDTIVARLATFSRR